MIVLKSIVGFEWDQGNARKNEKHGVSQSEAEQVFFDLRLLMVSDTSHSLREPRYHALGTTFAGRRLHITFTLRDRMTRIRIISARPMHRRKEDSMTSKAKVPRFKSEADERKFWETHDSAGLVDWSKGERVSLPNLKPSTQSISLRLPVHLLERIKSAANARDVPYQSLIKVWLEEKLSA